MITLTEKLNKVFSGLRFDSQRHLYFVNGDNYPSVSKLVESHAPKFDADTMLPFSVEKHNRNNPDKPTTIQELRQTWIDINKQACDLGHETHEFMEKYTGLERPTTPQQKAGVKFFRDYSSKYEIVFRELRMYSRKYKYAGTEDLILQERTTGRIITADYKTNKDLFKEYKGITLYPPFDSLVSTPYNKIQLQLSYYQIMLEEAGYKVEDRWLIYLKPDGEYKIFPLYDMTKILREHLESKYN